MAQQVVDRAIQVKQYISFLSLCNVNLNLVCFYIICSGIIEIMKQY